MSPVVRPCPVPASGPPAATGRKKRIVVVDDHEILRCGWQKLIAVEDDLEICGEAANAEEALAVTALTLPDLVVTDITLPGRSGLDLVKDLRARHPAIPLLVVSMHDEKIYGERVLRAGAMGYIMKESASEELVAAIRQVLQGRHFVSKALSDLLLRGLVTGPVKFPIDRLTDRELEIFALIGRGQSQAQIASQLMIKPRTVEAHRTNIRKKLGLKDSAELFRYAVRRIESGEHPD